MRGGDLAFTTLSNKDKDTLYFITYYEKDINDNTKYKYDENNQLIPIKTELYLGDISISSSANNLSPAAQDFLEHLPDPEEQNLSDGDLQVYVIEETGEVITNPETGESEKVTEGHWKTKSITDLISEFNGGPSGLVPQAPTEDSANKYLNGEGQWIDLNKKVIQEAISAIIGEGELNEDLDTLQEISEWILNHPSGAAEINERLTALEEATGVNKTATEERPKVDEEGNPVYVQKTQDDGEGRIKPLYWDGLTDEDKTTDNTGYPVMVSNPDGDEPSYVQEVDNDNKLYWNVTDETPKTDNDNGNPVFVQDTEIVEVPVENDVEIIKTVIGNLDTLYPQIQQAQIGTLDDRINDLDSRFQAIETVLIGQDAQGIKIVPIGSLEVLNEDLHTYDDNDNDTSSLVKAINMLDERMQWRIIPEEEQNP